MATVFRLDFIEFAHLVSVVMVTAMTLNAWANPVVAIEDGVQLEEVSREVAFS
ncbi:hypothetical protein [Aporhodopirellula aestuarii]|uniref:Uncharacterized protein n=1 Tax=Aporhodopirellula aestuarii TaxID=2950107 RepID=A0ABT0UAK8_9BACT|nr:hypothetical protein [Aporhodopirellula aestuarii]MCM2373555.1 hypothetical protein [Aporhodopirellula aestuarii]